MKIFALILSFFVLFLALEPGMDLLFGQNEIHHGCCGGIKEEPESQKQTNDCSQKVCNPFQKCSSCTIAFFSTCFNYKCQDYNCSRTETTIEELFISRFESDFWQPPKQA